MEERRELSGKRMCLTFSLVVMFLLLPHAIFFLAGIQVCIHPHKDAGGSGLVD